MREINKAGIDLIKGFEALRLSAYLCQAGVPTIGWGHTKGVKLGDRITREAADKLFAEDIQVYISAVEKNIRVKLNDNQFAALVSFAFNAGVGSLRASTLMRRLNDGDYNVAPSDNFDNSRNEFLKWIKVRNKKTG